MKKIIALLLACLFACQLPLALAGTSWYCPQCGRLNDNNFCPVDGTARPADTGSSSYPGITTSTGNYTTYAYITGTLNAKLATRTGPGTQYDEPGTFLSAGSQVTVLSKAYDTRNEIWWIQVEFSVSGSRYRAYTGLKRFTNLNVSTATFDVETIDTLSLNATQVSASSITASTGTFDTLIVSNASINATSVVASAILLNNKSVATEEYVQ